jgi:hypothetical protein
VLIRVVMSTVLPSRTLDGFPGVTCLRQQLDPIAVAAITGGLLQLPRPLGKRINQCLFTFCGELAMKRCFGGAILIAVGMILGGVLSSHDKIAVATAAQGAREDAGDAEALDLLRAIKTQVKEVNEVLHSGKLTVVVAINPDAS